MATQPININKYGYHGGPKANNLTCEGGAAAMMDRSHEIPQDLLILVRIVSACTLGLWAFAGGLLIGVFLFS
jgi:hypothetical protein